MANKYSPSINIKRDAADQHLYIPTKNSREAYNTIADNFKSGIHSYNIIGSYGTGKSAFLLAFYKHLQEDQEYFKPLNGQFNGCTKFIFIQIVGNYESFVTSLARELNVEANEREVYEAIRALQSEAKKNNECLVLVVDEFGKTLEFAAKNNPESELYFIQRIAEYANDSKRNFLFLTTLHQNFDAYAIGLKEKDRKEWEKVKGRIKELPFNEPVEQMLDLAGKAISKQIKIEKRASFTKKLLSIIKESNLFRLQNELSIESAKRLFPLEPLSASCLLIALQKYGQNERSLFNFIFSNEPFGINQHLDNEDALFYSLPNVYDYLMFNYSYLLQSKNNPDFFKWRVVITALDRVDTSIDSESILAKSVIKIIGLLTVMNSKGIKINLDFLTKYCKEALRVKKIEGVLLDLSKNKIIKYHKYKDSYSIYEGSDIDVEYEIQKKKEEVGRLQSIETHITRFLKLDYVVAKSISYKKGTPRIFKYEITNSPILEYKSKKSEIDGIINVVVGSDRGAIRRVSKVKDAVIYCFVSSNHIVLEQLNDIYIIDKILVEQELDKVARQELIEYKASLTSSFVSYFKESMFSHNSRWVVSGSQLNLRCEKALNRQLSELTHRVYPDVPKFRNELINKTKLSGSIQYAKKLYIKGLIENHDKPYLGFAGAKFPPERTIYHSLLEDTGIHQSDEIYNTATFDKPKDKSFQKLYDASNHFLESSKKGKRSVNELIEVLRKPPFKLKDGFLEFWLITFLFIKRDDYALYMDGAYVPNFSTEIAQLLFKKPEVLTIKGIEVDGVRLSLFNKYRALINKESSVSIKNRGFQEIAKPFLVFYKQLSAYSRNTKKYLSNETIKFRSTLLRAKELEKTFFEDLPKCFGFSLSELEQSESSLNAFAISIKDSIRELRMQDEKLKNRVFEALSNHIGLQSPSFGDLRNLMQERYDDQLDHLLDGKQKSLIQRIHSEIPEMGLWVSSLSQILIGKPLDKITDDEELVLLDRVKKRFSELDALLEIGSLKFDLDKEVALRYEIYGSDKKKKNNQIVLNEKDLNEIKILKKNMHEFLKDRDLKIKEGLFVQLLKELD